MELLTVGWVFPQFFVAKPTPKVIVTVPSDVDSLSQRLLPGACVKLCVCVSYYKLINAHI